MKRLLPAIAVFLRVVSFSPHGKANVLEQIESLRSSQVQSGFCSAFFTTPLLHWKLTRTWNKMKSSADKALISHAMARFGLPQEVSDQEEEKKQIPFPIYLHQDEVIAKSFDHSFRTLSARLNDRQKLVLIAAFLDATSQFQIERIVALNNINLGDAFSPARSTLEFLCIEWLLQLQTPEAMGLLAMQLGSRTRLKSPDDHGVEVGEVVFRHLKEMVHTPSKVYQLLADLQLAQVSIRYDYDSQKHFLARTQFSTWNHRQQRAAATRKMHRDELSMRRISDLISLANQVKQIPHK